MSNPFNILPRKGNTVQIENMTFPGALPLWTGLVSLGLGLCAFTPAWIAFSNATIETGGKIDAGGKVAAWIYSLVFGSIFTVMGLILLYVSRDLRRALPMKQLSEKFGVSIEELKRLARDNEIVPRYESDGRDLYDPEDFEIATLLRASCCATTNDELLRAAGCAQTQPEHLLRGASPAARPVTQEQRRGQG